MEMYGGVLLGPNVPEDGPDEPLPFVNPSSDNTAFYDNSKDGKKPRKKYTQTKQRENWSDDDHQKFIEALKLFDRDWKQLEKHIGTKTIPQIRSHAQKYFLKVQKSGSGEHIPPPRIPKRKQQKGPPENTTSTKNTNPDPEHPSIQQSRPDSSSSNLPTLPGVFPTFPTAFTAQAVSTQQDQLQHARLSFQSAMTTIKQTQEENQTSPDFSKIYSFLGTLFDKKIPHQNHFETLTKLSLVDREIVKMLMMNLEWNIEQHQYKEQHIFGLEKYHEILEGKLEDSKGEDEENGEHETRLLNEDDGVFGFSEESDTQLDIHPDSLDFDD